MHTADPIVTVLGTAEVLVSKNRGTVLLTLELKMDLVASIDPVAKRTV